jgi:hypothetical protein
VLVTWASCGGDICIGEQRLPMPRLDAGADAGPDAGDDPMMVAPIDAGPDEDAGEATP